MVLIVTYRSPSFDKKLFKFEAMISEFVRENQSRPGGPPDVSAGHASVFHYHPTMVFNGIARH